MEAVISFLMPVLDAGSKQRISGISQANSRAGSVEIKQEEEPSDGDLPGTIQEKESDIVASSSLPSPHSAINNNTFADPPSADNNIQASDA